MRRVASRFNPARLQEFQSPPCQKNHRHEVCVAGNLHYFVLTKFMRQLVLLSSASMDSPFINSPGMPFVPVPRFSTLVCIWPTRVREFEVYASE